MEKQQEFNMEKVFQPNQVESRIYDMWEHSGAFKPVVDPDKKPFVIVMPPPNITGQLHIGHALDEMPQDVLIRYHRMKGDPTLWVPGTDHAAIATEVKVVDALRKEGLTKNQIGREKFLERTWEWKRSTAEGSSASCASWVCPATGVGSALRWTRACPAPCGRLSCASTRRA